MKLWAAVIVDNASEQPQPVIDVGVYCTKKDARIAVANWVVEQGMPWKWLKTASVTDVLEEFFALTTEVTFTISPVTVKKGAVKRDW